MFYCEPCRLEKDWPESIMRWRSVCEVCQKYSDDCNDIPSSALPSPSAASKSSTQENK